MRPSRSEAKEIASLAHIGNTSWAPAGAISVSRWVARSCSDSAARRPPRYPRHGDHDSLELRLTASCLPSGENAAGPPDVSGSARARSEEHTSELQSRGLISYAV